MPAAYENLVEGDLTRDSIAQARTGTGKTLAFLVPIINSVLQHDQSLLQRTSRVSMRAPDVRALVISPT